MGDLAVRSGWIVLRNSPRVSTCLVVMSIGKSVTFSLLESLDGYGDRKGGGGSSACMPGGAGGVGGIVVCGFGDVSAYTRAAATESAMVLNSATGVIWFLSFSISLNGPAGALISRKGGSAALRAGLEDGPDGIGPVSYTHLTLPTKRIV